MESCQERRFYGEQGSNKQRFSNGNRTEWSPSRSVIILVITQQRESDLFIKNMITDYDTKSYYQLIIKITISEKKKNS